MPVIPTAMAITSIGIGTASAERGTAMSTTVTLNGENRATVGPNAGKTSTVALNVEKTAAPALNVEKTAALALNVEKTAALALNMAKPRVVTRSAVTPAETEREGEAGTFRGGREVRAATPTATWLAVKRLVATGQAVLRPAGTTPTAITKSGATQSSAELTENAADATPQTQTTLTAKMPAAVTKNATELTANAAAATLRTQTAVTSKMPTAVTQNATEPTTNAPATTLLTQTAATAEMPAAVTQNATEATTKNVGGSCADRDRGAVWRAEGQVGGTKWTTKGSMRFAQYARDEGVDQRDQASGLRNGVATPSNAFRGRSGMRGSGCRIGRNRNRRVTRIMPSACFNQFGCTGKSEERDDEMERGSTEDEARAAVRDPATARTILETEMKFSSKTAATPGAVWVGGAGAEHVRELSAAVGGLRFAAKRTHEFGKGGTGKGVGQRILRIGLDSVRLAELVAILKEPAREQRLSGLLEPLIHERGDFSAQVRGVVQTGQFEALEGGWRSLPEIVPRRVKRL